MILEQFEHIKTIRCRKIFQLISYCYIQNKSVVPYTGSHIIDIDLVYVNINLKVFCHFIHLKLLLKQLCLLTSYYVRSLSQVQCDNLIVQRHQLALSLCQTGRSTDSYQSGAYKQQQFKNYVLCRIHFNYYLCII